MTMWKLVLYIVGNNFFLRYTVYHDVKKNNKQEISQDNVQACVIHVHTQLIIFFSI